MSRIRTIVTAAAVATVSMVVGASSAHAGFTTVNDTPYAGERNVDDILGTTYGGTFTAAGNDYSNGSVTATRIDDNDDQSFSGVVLSIKALAKFAGFGQDFGVAEGGVFTSLMDTTGNGYGIVGSTLGPIDLSDKDYHFARKGGGTTVSALDSANADGLDHMVTYQLSGTGIDTPTYVLFFEDLLGRKADRDFNDLVVELTAAPVAVPLPGAIGMGLATLAGGTVFRKRLSKVGK